ncbi:MAG: polysaccharide export protein [Acidobacteria bacterium]|nr:polysaccharide export protein [Acidobacteriota bacterium]
MTTFVQCVVFVAGSMLTCQLSMAAPAQGMAPSAVVAPRLPSPSPERLTGTGSAEGQPAAGIPAHGETNSVGQADGKGDPALGGERHPLYRLTKSDVLDINFTFSPEFNQSLTVQPDGFVALRGARAVFAEGLSIAELQQLVVAAYSHFLHDPEVTVTLKDFEKPYFLASGEVTRPGKYELRGDLTVNEALAVAGGLTQQARHSQVVLFRRVSLDVAEAHLIDVKKMLNSRNLREDWHLRPGDFIFVPQSRISKVRKFVPASAMNWYLNPLQF